MEEKKGGSCFLKGCFGCLGISAVVVILLAVVIVGGGYWFYKNKALVDEPYYFPAKKLEQAELKQLEQKFQSAQNPTAATNKIVLNERELTHLVSTKLKSTDLGLELGKSGDSKLDVAGVDITLPEDEMDIKLSLKVGERYLNARLIGVPEIVEDRLEFNARDFEINQMNTSSSTILNRVNGRMNLQIAETVQHLGLQPYLKQVDKIKIENGSLSVNLKSGGSMQY